MKGWVAQSWGLQQGHVWLMGKMRKSHLHQKRIWHRIPDNELFAGNIQNNNH